MSLTVQFPAASLTVDPPAAFTLQVMAVGARGPAGAPGGGPGGGLSSIGLSVPAGLQVTGSPLTADGTLALSYQAGYSIPTNVKQGQWDAAFGWGNHALAGYLSSVKSVNGQALAGAGNVTVGTLSSVGLTMPTGLTVTGSPLTADGTLAVSFAAGYSIPTTAKQGQWDAAYGWGNHALAGYISSLKTINGQALVGAGNIVINDGVDGTDGKTVHNGTGAPSDVLGVDGDFYIDKIAAVLYGPKVAGAWPAGVSLVGPAGASGEMGTYTWAAKPAASANTGKRIRISDYGIAPGLIVVSDGTRWLVDGRQVLTRSTVNSTAITGTTTETTFSTGAFTIPADLLGPNGTLVVAPIVGFTSNANNKSVRIRYAGALVAGWTGANQTTLQLPATIYNRGSASTQAGMWGTTATSIGFTTAAINTAVDVAVTITGQHANAADSMTLHGYIVEVLP